jgi:hypothetical protein
MYKHTRSKSGKTRNELKEHHSKRLKWIEKTERYIMKVNHSDINVGTIEGVSQNKK